MIKTKRKSIISKNKTLKNNKKYINQILSEWKKQTNGNVHKDTTTIYKGDYYLSLSKHHEYNTHVHLITHNFYKDDDTKILLPMKFGYLLKKYKNIHSKPNIINKKINPKETVSIMIKKFNTFLKK